MDKELPGRSVSYDDETPVGKQQRECLNRVGAFVLTRLRGAAVPDDAGTFIQAGHVKFPESREEADAMILVAEAWIKSHQTPAAETPVDA